MRKSFKLPFLLIGAVLIMGNSNSLLSLDKMINKFGWEKRIVLLIADNEDVNLIRGVESFFKEGACQNRNRNLELYKIIGDEITKYKIPKRYEGRRGIWLIGYDRGDKAYSRDLSLLNQLYEIIDEMPIRQNEMLHQDSRCD
jgi:hypothetical protein|tara:strand:+ start:235 stop:660 length:426 start_codon:yes stop_codon:yes gene_type:complete